MKRTLLILLLVYILVFTGCNSSEEVPELNIGSMPTQSAAIYAVGIEKGFFEEVGISVNLTIFNSAQERDAAVVAGELDGFMTDMMGHLNLVKSGYKYKITSYEYENFAIMSMNGQGAAIHDGASIGLANHTVTEFVVDSLLKDININKVNIPKIPDRMATLLNGETDLGVFPEPLISIIKGKGGIIAESSEIDNLQPVVLVFSDEAIEEKRKSIEGFYSGYNKAVDYLKENSKEDYNNIIVEYGLVDEEIIDIVNLPIEQFGYARMPEQIDFDKVMIWMETKEVIESSYSLEDVSDSSFIK